MNNIETIKKQLKKTTDLSEFSEGIRALLTVRELCEFNEVASALWPHAKTRRFYFFILITMNYPLMINSRQFTWIIFGSSDISSDTAVVQGVES